MHRINLTLVFFLIFTVVTSGLAYTIVMSAYDSYGDIYIVEQSHTKTLKPTHVDLITISFPQKNTVVMSPLVIKGKARGNWYFEASFPVRLFDGDGKEIALTPAHAKGDPASNDGASWMTTQFVPFEATLTFVKPNTPNGTLVLIKDNPSGDPAKDDSISIPVRF